MPVNISRTQVLAVVVSFNPDEALLDNLLALKAEAPHVLLIDNASTNSKHVRKMAQDAQVEIVENSENLGVSGALNQAIRYAQINEFLWLWCFDQDSKVAKNCMRSIEEFSDVGSIFARAAIISVPQRDIGTGRAYHNKLDILKEESRYRLMRSVITSGSLISLAAVEQIGLFDQTLFIDSVDHEFCLRARRAGWCVVEIQTPPMAHAIGNSEGYSVMGIRLISTHHSAIRRYYITRNQLEVSRRFFLFDPIWSAKGIAYLISGLLSVLINEDQKRQKILHILMGARDFILRRFGRLS